jgi:predicted NUDIX family NTP pyrophosphohydrolase
MPKKSAGILWYRFQHNAIQVFLVHPGGPFWRNKNSGTWSIPKGEFEDGEEPLKAAKREMHEETGIDADATGMRTSEYIELDPVRQKSGKIIYAWTAQGDFNPSELTSNSFEIEWPPKSGKKATFPEIDKGKWFTIDEAKKAILPYQLPLIIQLQEVV